MANVKTICTEQEHAEAIAEAGKLWDSPQGTPEADRLIALMISIAAYESKFPPNAETIAAMEAGERGEVTCFDGVEAMMNDLKAED
jgi:antitoxin component HigA of HigAB toxin-antitoxin module